MIKYYVEAKRKVLDTIFDRIDDLSGNDQDMQDLYDKVSELFDEIDLKIDREND